MKFIAMICLGACLVSTTHAQLFTPESFGGAALGGVIGGVIGHNQHGQTAEGAAIGAGIGYLLGEVTHASRRQAEAQAYGYPSYYPYHQYSAAPPVGYAPVYSYDRPNPLYAPYRYSRPNYALGGAALGGITGAIIGNQVHGQTGEGAAIGAAAGLLLGGLAEREARRREAAAPLYSYQPPPQLVEVASPPVAQTPEPIQNPAPPPSAMSGANRLFGR